MRSLSSAILVAGALTSAGVGLGKSPAAGVPSAMTAGSSSARKDGPVAQPLPPAADPGPTPIGTPGYDQVGYAAWLPAGATAAAHATLPPGSFAEVIALDSGRTLLVPIGGVARAGHEIELPAAVAEELGLSPGKPASVRVRAAQASPADLAILRTGRTAVARADAPPVLLTALRRKLGAGPAREMPGVAAKAAPVRPVPLRADKPLRPTQPVTATPAGPGYYVQIAALSDATRAAALARLVGGRVSSTGTLHRVRLGPFAGPRRAQAARDAVARRGYGDARIVRD